MPRSKPIEREPQYTRRIFERDFLVVNEYQNHDGSKFLVFTTLGLQSMSPAMVQQLTETLAKWQTEQKGVA